MRSELPDPKIRKDGKCARPGCTKTIVIARNPKVTDDRLMSDPFCSTECAKIYHGVKNLPQPERKH